MARRRTFIGLMAVATLAAALGGCRLKDQPAPALVGPSELGLSLTTSVVPDLLTRDGSAQAVITVTARNDTGSPKANVSLKLDAVCDTSSGQLPVDVGGLSSDRLTTGQDGRATTIYRAPTEEDFVVSYCSTSYVYIFVRPIGDNFQNSVSRTVELRLIPDPDTPVASFSFSPTSPATNETIIFDASVSHAAAGRKLVAYFWQFGTDRTGSGITIDKTYGTAATYNVTLTVTDDLGHKGRLTRPVTVH